MPLCVDCHPLDLKSNSHNCFCFIVCGGVYQSFRRPGLLPMPTDPHPFYAYRGAGDVSALVPYSEDHAHSSDGPKALPASEPKSVKVAKLRTESFARSSFAGSPSFAVISSRCGSAGDTSLVQEGDVGERSRPSTASRFGPPQRGS